MMSRLTKIAVVSMSVLIFSYVGLGYVLGKTDDDKSYRSLSVYGEVLQRVQEDYVDEPNLQVVTVGALRGLLDSLDPYSGYLSPREYTDYKDKQKNDSHSDVGATVSKRFGYIVVVSVLPDSAAEKGGLRSGDILEAVSGFATRDMSVGQANALLQGAPGSTVKVDVVRRGSTEPQPVTLTREVTAAQHLTADKVADDTGYVRIPSLQAGAVAELRDKLARFQQQGLHKVILDLRNCSTGPVSEGVAAAQLFLPSGNVATLRGQTVSEQKFDAAPDKALWKGPVEVLISDSTSGAAEIIAAALGDNHRADLVGGRTFGAASEQKLIPLEDGSALVLTVAFYYTPGNKAILDQGVPATVPVTLSPTDLNAADQEAPGPLRANQLPGADDPVMHKALDLVQQKKAANEQPPAPFAVSSRHQSV
jgi:carboxyl-terminal processing protease